jgi:outer membrane protein assembly factor BamB
MRLGTKALPGLAALIAGSAAIAVSAAPTIYPTGTTIFEPTKTWSGFTVFIAPGTDGAIVVDMNGNTVKIWEGFDGTAGGPARVLPAGHVLAGGPARAPHQESNALIELDFDGKEVWRYDHTEQVENASGEKFWSARQHHDWQREGLPGGYYSPEAAPQVDRGRTLMLVHKNHVNRRVSDKVLEDDRLIEISWSGEILWDWLISDHVDELGLSADARRVIRNAPNFNAGRGSVDWMHTNSATYVGPNRWYDAGDERFNPDNVMISSRQANFIAIVARDGKIVWRLGPDYRSSDEMSKIGQIIGQHNPHIIPKGLPGAGNLLVFDNGGTAGYGFANPAAPNGVDAVRRYNSRVLEIDPTTLEKVWEYSIPGLDSYRFFSHYVSSAQRLPNGNTMITEGADGRIFEVTPEGENVWEYVSPYSTVQIPNTPPIFRVYRAYRVPYDWIPQLARPIERRVRPPRVEDFRLAPE